MPHQCLKCGYIFEDSSGTYQRGCPNCQGHRFFYTKNPPTHHPQQTPAQHKPIDVNEKVMNLIIEKNETLKNTADKGVSLTPKELRDLIEQKLDEHQTKKTTASLTDADPQTRFQNIHKKPAPHPETIAIEHSGKYQIDLQGLLEKEPIVIQKDGTYTIHLPSAFQTLRKKQ
jgi:predicted  nucleic acid-binding Zn-ribbon protein